MSLVTIFLSSQCFHSAYGTGLWQRKGWQHPSAVQTYRKSSCNLYTLIYTRPHYLPARKELINVVLRGKKMYRKEGKNKIGKHDTCQCSPMICYLLCLLQGDVLLTVQSKTARTQLLGFTLLWMHNNCKNCALKLRRISRTGRLAKLKRVLGRIQAVLSR